MLVRDGICHLRFTSPHHHLVASRCKRLSQGSTPRTGTYYCDLTHMSSLKNTHGIPKHNGQAKLPARKMNCIYAFFFEPIRFSVPARKRAMFSL